jgi:hypothetical protein
MTDDVRQEPITDEGTDEGRQSTPSDAVLPDQTPSQDSSLPYEGKQRCGATTKAGTPCAMPSLRNSDPPRCWSHSDGGPQASGRMGGLNRRRPGPARRTMPAPITPLPSRSTPSTLPTTPALDEALPVDVTTVMSAAEVRLYLQNAVTRALAGQLDPDLAKIAVSATTPWLRAIELDERVADIERRLLKLERHDTADEATP